ncbi:MAG: exodeoxyribonuclease V subunit gamma [Alphaproteobacteria bacterium]|nr:exodeoxyribonuclease V subunit gamma [Alphaproteobacteria bacterium]
MHVHRSNRMERLADGLARVLAQPPATCADPSTLPFVPERLVVQSRGMADWARLQVAGRLGAVAHVRVQAPRAAITELLAAVVGQGSALEASALAWRRERVAWVLLQLLPDLLPASAGGLPASGEAAGTGSDAPGFEALGAWLRADASADPIARRWQLARRIAHVFDQYAAYRPELVLGWSAGGHAGHDGAPLPAADAWQPVLWRALEARLGTGHVAGLLAAFDAALAPFGSERPEGLPPRLVVFGITTLPPLYLHVLSRLSAWVEVHLFLLSPSPEWWADVRGKRERRRAIAEVRDPDAAAPPDDGHPLLANLGRVGRDLLTVLVEGVDDYDDDADYVVADTPPAEVGGAMLQVLQDDVARVVTPALRSPRPAIAPADTSLQVHGCHAPTREVEVLRDQLLALLQADPTLRPRDIVVLTPDIGLHGPLIDAVFGVEPDDPLHLPYAIADRPVAAGNDVARIVSDVMGLVGARLTAPEVMDLLSHAPVRRRFDLSDEDVGLLEELVSASGIRWGRDARHRDAVGQPAVPQNTWAFGLERLLLGHAVADPRPVAGRVPMVEIEGDASVLVGQLAELVDAVLACVDGLADPRPPAAWVEAFGAVLARLVGDDEASADEAQRVRDTVAGIAEAAAAAGWTDAVPLRVMRELVEGALLEERRQGAFLRAGVTFCEMLPMRSIPARVVCLLGLSDGVFPRADARLGFDLVARHPRVGDRSKRHDDRYLVLEALLSARDALVITYVSHGVQDNKPLPPSVVLAELLDAVDATFATPAGFERPRDRVVVDHPLQPFGAAYVTSDDRRLFTYDAAAAEAARRLRAGRAPEVPFLRGAVPPTEPTSELDLDQLVRFLDDPVLWFWERRLGIGRPEELAVLDDREPFEVEGLAEHLLGDHLLQLRAEGLSWLDCRARLDGEGVLPLGHRANPLLARVARRVDGILAAAHGRLQEPTAPPVVLDLACDGVRLTGRVGSLRAGARVDLGYATVSPGGHRLRLWVRHLALQVAAGAHTPRASELYGRQGDRAGRMVTYPPLDAREAAATLRSLVGLWRAGQERPLPFLPDAAWSFLAKVRTGDAPERALWPARKAARDRWAYRGRSADAWARLVGGEAALDLDGADGPSFAALSEQVLGPAWQAEGT